MLVIENYSSTWYSTLYLITLQNSKFGNSVVFFFSVDKHNICKQWQSFLIFLRPYIAYFLPCVVALANISMYYWRAAVIVSIFAFFHTIKEMCLNFLF